MADTGLPFNFAGYSQVAAAWVVLCFSLSILASHNIWQSQMSALLSSRLQSIKTNEKGNFNLLIPAVNIWQRRHSSESSR